MLNSLDSCKKAPDILSQDSLICIKPELNSPIIPSSTAQKYYPVFLFIPISILIIPHCYCFVSGIDIQRNMDSMHNCCVNVKICIYTSKMCMNIVRARIMPVNVL